MFDISTGKVNTNGVINTIMRRYIDPALEDFDVFPTTIFITSVDALTAVERMKSKTQTTEDELFISSFVIQDKDSLKSILKNMRSFGQKLMTGRVKKYQCLIPISVTLCGLAQLGIFTMNDLPDPLLGDSKQIASLREIIEKELCRCINVETMSADSSKGMVIITVDPETHKVHVLSSAEKTGIFLPIHSPIEPLAFSVYDGASGWWRFVKAVVFLQYALKGILEIMGLLRGK